MNLINNSWCSIPGAVSFPVILAEYGYLNFLSWIKFEIVHVAFVEVKCSSAYIFSQMKVTAHQ
uniref:Uncharacterized protein n=1 Tax=Arion vulgaris TaxID=1028688 RepID=A0A0B6YP20_9EUPU